MNLALLSDFNIPALFAISVLTLVFFWAFLTALLPRPKVGDYGNKYILVTGCDTGFGREVAVRLDQLGFHVIATCLTNEGKEKLKTTCSGCLVAVLMDITDSRQIQDVYKQVRELVPQESGLWAIVNNAGYLILAPLEWFKMEDFKKSADVNLWGMIEVIKTFLPLVKKAKGRVVNMSSISGLLSRIGNAAYAVPKYGVEAFSDVLRREMVSWDVKVSIIEPQPFKTTIWTDVTGKRLENIWQGKSDEIKREYGFDYPETFAKRIDDYMERRASTQTYLVTHDIIDAVTSCDPSPRYRCGWSATYVAFLAILPTSLQDFPVRNL